MEAEHLRMDLMQRQKPCTTIPCIAFQQPTHYEWVRAASRSTSATRSSRNHYRGMVTTTAEDKDIKPIRNNRRKVRP